MHPGAGPWAEAVGLYVEGSGLAQRLLERVNAGLAGNPPQGSGRSGDSGAVVVFDVGLGGGANALAAVECHRALSEGGRNPRPLHLVSFERAPEGLEFAREEAEALGYPRGHEDTLDDLLEEHRAEPAPGITWELRVGDFSALIHEEPHRADIVFFDPFSPKANPGLWSLETLEGLYACRRRGASTVLVTYSSAFNTRAAMLLAGFYVGEGPLTSGPAAGSGQHGRPSASRGHTTVAATEFQALEHPLTPGWLGRWRRERNPWPPGTPPSKHRQLRTALVEHSQWAYGSPPRPVEEPRAGKPQSGTPPPVNPGSSRRSRARARQGNPPEDRGPASPEAGKVNKGRRPRYPR